MKESTQKALVCLFFAIVLIAGLFVSSYGQPWDELDEMDIVRMNLWEYARIFGLDETAFETYASYDAPTISPLTPISESIEKDHGNALFYPLGAVLLSDTFTQAEQSRIWQGYCYVLFVMGAFALYACARGMSFSRPIALLTVMVLLLSPRFFAEAHYNNKDVMLFSLLLCMLWQTLAFSKHPSYGHAMLLGLFAGFASNTKIIAAGLFGLCGLWLVLAMMHSKLHKRTWIPMAIVSLLSFFLTYVFITPAMWENPLAFVSYLVENATAFTRWNGYILFRGAIFFPPETPLPWYYLPYMMIATTPLWIVILACIGLVVALYTMLKTKKFGFELLVILLFLVPLGTALFVQPVIYNGWRHFYFLYAPLLILASIALDWFWSLLRIRKITAIVLAVCMGFTAVTMMLSHPYQMTYYQPLVAMKNTNGQFLELDYWNVSAKDALTSLCKQNSEPFTITYADIFTEYGLKRNLYALQNDHIQLVENMEQADYVLVNPTYALFSGYESPKEAHTTIEIESFGMPLVRIDALGGER